MCGRCQKNCDKVLHYLTIDRGAPCVALSCYQAVGGLRLAGPALSFAKLRSGKSQAKRPGSRLRTDSLQSLCRPLGRSPGRDVRQIDRGKDAGAAAAVPVVRRSDAGPICECPVLWRADERADIAISTGMTLNRHAVFDGEHQVVRFNSRAAVRPRMSAFWSSESEPDAKICSTGCNWNGYGLSLPSTT